MQERVVREIRMLRLMWRELETGSRTSLAGHEGGNPGYRQGMFSRVTAPALDPTNLCLGLENLRNLEILAKSTAIAQENWGHLVTIQLIRLIVYDI